MILSDPTFADYADGTETPMPDWIDNDFINAVVAIGKELPNNVIPFPAAARKKSDTYSRMREMAARTRKRRVR
ncbi:hypothetical protein K0B90_03155 [bacterium]|nr:hypothetical protein [bacterium]